MLHVFLLSALEGDEWSASYHSRFTSGKSPQSPLSCSHEVDAGPYSKTLIKSTNFFPISVAPILLMSFHLSALISSGIIYYLCASCSSHLKFIYSKFIALKFV